MHPDLVNSLPIGRSRIYADSLPSRRVRRNSPPPKPPPKRPKKRPKGAPFRPHAPLGPTRTASRRGPRLLRRRGAPRRTSSRARSLAAPSMAGRPAKGAAPSSPLRERPPPALVRARCGGACTVAARKRRPQRGGAWCGSVRRERHPSVVCLCGAWMAGGLLPRNLCPPPPRRRTASVQVPSHAWPWWHIQTSLCAFDPRLRQVRSAMWSPRRPYMYFSCVP
eukprot:scaffold7576_cov417-Prasinococcus_capsulatus_cf.AAC.8